MLLYTLLSTLSLTRALAYSRSTPSSVATFNDYVQQGSTVCCPKNIGGSGPPSPFFTSPSGTPIFGAAAADLSTSLSRGLCSGSQDLSACSGGSPVSGYQGPACPTSAYCSVPQCYSVLATSGFNGSSIPSAGTFAPITVRVIDVCPTNHAQNYCPVLNVPGADTPGNRSQRCEMDGEDALDIDVNAYGALVGRAQPARKQDSDPNLDISITPIDCPAGTPAPGACDQ